MFYIKYGLGSIYEINGSGTRYLQAGTVSYKTHRIGRKLKAHTRPCIHNCMKTIPYNTVISFSFRTDYKRQQIKDHALNFNFSHGLSCHISFHLLAVFADPLAVLCFVPNTRCINSITSFSNIFKRKQECDEMFRPRYGARSLVHRINFEKKQPFFDVYRSKNTTIEERNEK